MRKPNFQYHYMIPFLFLISLFCCTQALQAKPLPMYQVDIIVFTHQHNQIVDDAAISLFELNKAPKVALKHGSGKKPYQLLPLSASEIRNEQGILNKKPQYNVLLHYSWLQPSNNQRAVILPPASHNGWEVSGILRIRKNNFYLLDTELKFDPFASNHSPFTLIQNQRVEEGIIYYLDHPQAGILIKIHSVS